MPVTWVIGASGLLGQPTYEQACRRGHLVLRSHIPWDSDPADAATALHAAATDLLETAGAERWNVIWVAGAGVVGTPPQDLENERLAYADFLQRFSKALGRRGTRNGSLFFASSAGGVYAGSSGSPFTEDSSVQPLAPYGHNKLAMEDLTRTFVAETGVPAMLGRISNLYGPGQNLAKAQGLVSQLAKAYLLRRPLMLYVSLDTIRDYLYVGDCARMVLRAVERMSAAQPSSHPVTKILASGQPTSIAELLGVFMRIFKRRAPLVLGDSPNRRLQVRDLRMRSVVWNELDHGVSTTLPAGIRATVEDLAARLRAGELVAS